MGGSGTFPRLKRPLERYGTEGTNALGGPRSLEGHATRKHADM
jgi:hypothetical protein